MSEALVRCRCGGRLDWRPDGSGCVVEFCVGNDRTLAPPCGYERALGGWQLLAGQLPHRNGSPPTSQIPLRIIAPVERRFCPCGRRLRRTGLQYPYEKCSVCRHRPGPERHFRRRCHACGRPLRARGGHAYDDCYRCRTTHRQVA